LLLFFASLLYFRQHRSPLIDSNSAKAGLLHGIGLSGAVAK